MKNRRNYTKYIFIVSAVVFIVAAALLFLELWEKSQGIYNGEISQNGVITFNGTEYIKNNDIETFLVMGLDKYDGASMSDSHESGIQADFLMLFVFDNSSKQSHAIHINRDTMAKINRLAIGGTKIDTFTKQISLAYNYVADDNDKIRCRNTKDSVEMLLCNTHIDHYFALTMDAVATMNDLVGGVEVTLLDDFTDVDASMVKGSTVTLKGEQALRYVRSRYGLEDSTNISRMKRQQQYINALYDKTVSYLESDEGLTVEFADTMDDYVVYDSSDEKMQKFAEKFKTYEFMGIKEIEGESKVGEKYIEFYPDEDSVLKIVIESFYKPKTDKNK